MDERAALKKIVVWYETHQRSSLPWRKTRNPYHILVSEVMLQQTQVERVIAKYQEFIRLFPTVHSLAKATPADVIRAWAGLGYNRRALYLQRTAESVVRVYGGVFPQNIETLKTLPGIGDYTARAILSFAFEEPVPMMDTNHRRFYQRVFFGIHKKDDRTLLRKAVRVIEKLGSSRIARGDAVYHWNQALMDFGSAVCRTTRPECRECPIKKYCKAYPKILISKKSGVRFEKQKTTPFRETDRYVRGRIIDTLRTHDAVLIPRLAKDFPHVSPERFATILQKLITDGLIVQKGRSILLP